MFDTLREAARIATWAPDEARELIARVEPTDDLGVARAAELLAKIGAVTTQWELAREMYDEAAAAWESHDAARATALRAIGRCLPLAPFTTDVDAIASEIEIVRRVFEEGRPAPVVQRAVIELRRALAPRPVTGVIERAFGLSPGEMAYVMAAAAPALEADVLPVTGVDDWRTLLGASSLDGEVALGRAALLVKETPALVPHPALVSRLLGRATVENPIGCTVSFVAPGAAPANAGELGRALLVERRLVAGPRVDQLAAIAAQHDLRVMQIKTQAATSLALAAALVEAGLHGAVLALDAEEWRHVKLPAQGPLFVIARRPIAGAVAISSGR